MNFSIAGTVEQVVTIEPRRIVLRGAMGKPIIKTVKITPNGKYSFRIVEAKADQGKNIRYTLDELKGSGGTVYVLTVENLLQSKGNYSDIIRLKTDSQIQPMISLMVSGNIFGVPSERK